MSTRQGRSQGIKDGGPYNNNCNNMQKRWVQGLMAGFVEFLPGWSRAIRVGASGWLTYTRDRIYVIMQEWSHMFSSRSQILKNLG